MEDLPLLIWMLAAAMAQFHMSQKRAPGSPVPCALEF